jgi:hypothetical protein
LDEIAKAVVFLALDEAAFGEAPRVQLLSFACSSVHLGILAIASTLALVFALRICVQVYSNLLGLNVATSGPVIEDRTD